MESAWVVFVVIAWVVIGLATGLWMVHRGHDRRWLVVALGLGPLFVPIALERVERSPRLAATGPDGPPAARAGAGLGPRILVGLDGSEQADRVLATTLTLCGAQCETLVLAEVVDHEAGEESHETLESARRRLAAVAATVRETGVPVRFEVLAGPPGPALRRFAEEQEMDVLVVGRRGRGRTASLLGSVSADLFCRSTVPVLVVEPSAPGSSAA